MAARWTILSLLLLSLHGWTWAHPGVGIVCDKRGNIYYTDLSRIWKIDLQGQRSIAVPGVHSHEICLDTAGNLYGEHLWYDGDASAKWWHYVWRRAPDGSIDTIRGVREGFLHDLSFVRDRDGNMYRAQQQHEQTVFQKISPTGAVSVVATVNMTGVRWLYSSRRGDLYFACDDALYMVTGNDCRRLASGLRDTREPFYSMTGKAQSLMGIWDDAEGNCYVAVFSGGVVKRISPLGVVSVAAVSPEGWSPSGGVTDPDGSLWLLENTPGNEVRARKVTATPPQAVAPVTPQHPGWRYLLPAAGLLAALLLGWWLQRRKKKTYS